MSKKILVVAAMAMIGGAVNAQVDTVTKYGFTLRRVTITNERTGKSLEGWGFINEGGVTVVVTDQNLADVQEYSAKMVKLYIREHRTKDLAQIADQCLEYATKREPEHPAFANWFARSCYFAIVADLKRQGY